MGPVNHTPGKVRYLTVWLIFPKDNERWLDQLPFCQPLDNFLKHTALEPKVKFDLIHKGEALEKKPNGMKVLYQIEEIERRRQWGKILPPAHKIALEGKS